MIRELTEWMMKLSVLFLLVVMLFILVENTLVFHDCYESHLSECEEAHNLNKTYSYCSGFLSAPSKLDFSSFCEFHPEEGCGKIPHGCVLIENEYFVRLRIPFTKMEWRFLE